MTELHQSYSEIMQIPTLELRGIVEACIRQQKAATESQNAWLQNQRNAMGIDGVNTGDIAEEDKDTSMWFKQ